MATFNFVGKIVPVKDKETFKGYTETVFPDSKWVKQRLVFNLVAGDNRHLVEINAGKWQDEKKNSVIYTMSRAKEDKKSEKIQIPWDKRNDPKTIETVAGNKIFTIDTDYFAHRKELEEAGDTAALEESNKKRRHFLAGTDFCDFAKKVVYSEKIKDWTFRVSGNIVYTYSEKTGRYYQSYEVNKIYRVDPNTESACDVNIPFYFAEGFMDKDSLEEIGKAIMSGYTEFYVSETKRNWFCPVALVMRGDSEVIDITEELLSNFEDSEVCKAVLSCQAINGAQKRDVNIEDLDERTQKAIKAGVMSEAQAIRNAGGQVYGERIQELRFKEILKHSEPTAYTLENCIEKPHVVEESVDIFNDSDEDSDDDI
jgi:hypothetical protein